MCDVVYTPTGLESKLLNQKKKNLSAGGRIYSGWWVVAAAIVGLSTGPGQFAFGALGLFIIPLGDEFGWNRAEISLALTFFTVALALSLPVVGGIVDRVGSRKVLIPSILIVGGFLALIPLAVSRVWHLLAIFVLMGSLGAGANSLPYMATISAWFDRHRGLAIGFAMGGAGLGYAYVPPLVQYLIDTSGWRSGYYALAAITVLVAAPVVYCFLRERPQELGLLPDGETTESAPAPAPVQPGVRRAQALRGREFWLLFFVFAVLSFSLYGLLPHVVPMLTDRGMPSARAALVASTVGVTIVFARVLIGFLIDRFFAPRVAAVSFGLSAVGLGLLAAGAVGPQAFVAAMLVGFSIGAEIDLMAFLTGRYFGLKCFGEIYGLMFAALLIGTSLGPLAFGAVFEMTGSYTGILVPCALTIIIACIVTALLPRYPDLASAPAANSARTAGRSDCA